MSSLIVRKYGGSSLATPQHFQTLAQELAQIYKMGTPLIIVVSAMGKTTDGLMELAYQVSPNPLRRELDMLLSTGERVSASLMSMALNDQGVPSISFTGSQAGILTDGSHTNAQITDVKPIRVEQELKNNKAIVLAGFQGVNPTTKEITTLGRGGTDLTAVAMASYFCAQQCEILKDVDGIFTADPKIVEEARRLDEVSLSSLYEMTFWGAKMLYYKAAQLAFNKNLNLYFGLSHQRKKGTWAKAQPTPTTDSYALTVNSHNRIIRVAWPTIHRNISQNVSALLSETLDAAQLPIPQILMNHDTELVLTAPDELLLTVQTCLSQKGWTVTEEGASVTVTFNNTPNETQIEKLISLLRESQIAFNRSFLSGGSYSFFLNSHDRVRAIQTLHQAI